jgi:hypothetical protein
LISTHIRSYQAGLSLGIDGMDRKYILGQIDADELHIVRCADSRGAKLFHDFPLFDGG